MCCLELKESPYNKRINKIKIKTNKNKEIKLGLLPFFFTTVVICHKDTNKSDSSSGHIAVPVYAVA